jgi:hypothetical protein
VPVSGEPHGDRPECSAGTADDPCSAASCDGFERDACEGFVGSSVSCRGESCEDGTFTPGGRCDGDGACPSAEARPCAPYVCAGDRCATSCATDEDCAATFTCDADVGRCVGEAECRDERTVVAPDGTSADCAPYRCEAGACNAACESALDCVHPNVCDADGACVAPEPSTYVDGGCGCRVAGSARTGRAAGLPAGGFVVVALAAFTARRRRPVPRGT